VKPGDFIDINLTPVSASVGTGRWTEPSFENFRTMVFHQSFMREHIRAGQHRIDYRKDDEGNIQSIIAWEESPGRIDVGLWLSFVPECYRADVWRGVESMFRRFDRQRLTTTTVLAFVEALWQWIGENVEPQP
jgi:hypothetical protein